MNWSSAAKFMNRLDKLCSMWWEHAKRTNECTDYFRFSLLCSIWTNSFLSIWELPTNYLNDPTTIQIWFCDGLMNSINLKLDFSESCCHYHVGIGNTIFRPVWIPLYVGIGRKWTRVRTMELLRIQWDAHLHRPDQISQLINLSSSTGTIQNWTLLFLLHFNINQSINQSINHEVLYSIHLRRYCHCLICY